MASNRLLAIPVRFIACLVIACTLMCGCSFSPNKNLTYVGKPEPEELITSKFTTGDVPDEATTELRMPYTSKPRTTAPTNRNCARSLKETTN